ncbi:MAG TPA: O-antigen ligase family protein [Vicinamibacterales bacterium]|nr:O-antigen ligase family protein [Vicinamibacterales bacterium]
MIRPASASAAAAVPAAPSDRFAALAQALPLCTIAWGALAFGAVYPWAYWPLAGASVVSGVAALSLANRARVRTADRAFTAALAGFAAVVLVQLAPLPLPVLAALSPNAASLLRDLDPAFAAGLTPRHPLSVWPRDTAVALALYSSFALLLVGMTRLFAVTGVRRFVEALTAFAVLLAVIGIVQKPLYSGAIYGLWDLELGRTPFGPFVNRNHFAGWMVMALPMTLALLSAGIDRGMRGLKPGWRYKVLWFSSPEASQLILVAAACIVMALSLMMTMSRSGITAFVLSLLMFGWFITRTLDTSSRRMAAGACLLLLTAVVVAWTGPQEIIGRFAAGDWGEFNNRRGAWADAWSVARDFPLAGTGLNTYWAAALFYQRHEMEFFFAQAHNDYLQLAAEGGLLLVIPAIACLGIFFRDVRRAMREQRGSHAWWLRAGAVTSLVAIAFQESVEFSLQMPGNAALFAVVCAVALHRPIAPDSPPVPESGQEQVPRLRLVKVRPAHPVVRSRLDRNARSLNA